MEFEFTKSFPPISDDELRQFELEEAVRLPEDCCHFLLLHNGGQPEARCFDYLKNDRKISACMYGFFGLNKQEYYDLGQMRRQFLTQVPSNLLAVGLTLADDMVCVSISGTD